MRALLIASTAALLAAPAAALTFTASGSVFATTFTEIPLPAFPAYAPHNGRYTFSMTLSRPADVATIITYDHTSFTYEEWHPGGHFSGGDDYGIEQVMATASNATAVSGMFTGASYRAVFQKAPWDSYSRYREWFSSRPIFAELYFPNDGPLDYSITMSGAVPEPEHWALMVAGFGLAGAALRGKHHLKGKFAVA